MIDDVKGAVHDGYLSTSAEEADGVSVGEMFEALSDHRRRYALYILTDAEEPMAVRRLAEQMAAWLHETTLGEVSDDELRRTYVGLRHNHLPKLADLGVLEYDEDTDLVAVGHLGPFEEFLAFAAARER